MTGREAVHEPTYGLPFGAATTRGTFTPMGAQRQGASGGFSGANPVLSPLAPGFGSGNETSPTPSPARHLRGRRGPSEEQHDEERPAKRHASGDNSANSTVSDEQDDQGRLGDADGNG